MKAKIKKVLITGGAGFIGSHLGDSLIKEGYRVVVLDNFSSGRKENVHSGAKLYKADITSLKISTIFQEEKPDFVFHFAAHIEARESLKNPIFDAKTNILGSLNVLENCRKFKVRKIIFASSGGEIYGPSKKIPTPETYNPRPVSPYGAAKLAVEKYLDVYYHLFKLPYVSLRYGNVYGPRQNPKGEAGVVAIFTGRMLAGEPVFVHGSGSQTKDYIFIDDAMKATMLAFQKHFRGVINIGTGKETSVMEIFRKVKRLSNSKVEERHTPLPIGSFKRGCLDVSKAKKELGWQPKVDLDQGLELTVSWFKNKVNYAK